VRVCTNQHAIVALIQECAGFLAVPRCGDEFHAVLVHFDGLRNVSMQQLHIARETFTFTCGNIVASQNSLATGELAQRLNNDVLMRSQPGRQQLRHEVVAIAVDHQ